MNAEKRREIQNWLRRSHSDLRPARRLLDGPEPLPDASAFRAQQAAEKALKALLAYHDLPLARTNDLTELVALAAEIEVSATTWEAVAHQLTPYAVHYRYPGDVLEPDLSEARQAVEHATAILEWVLSALPRETTAVDDPCGCVSRCSGGRTGARQMVHSSRPEEPR